VSNAKARVQLLIDARKAMTGEVHPEAKAAIDAAVKYAQSAASVELTNILSARATTPPVESSTPPVRTNPDARLRLENVIDSTVSVDPETKLVTVKLTLVGREKPLENAKVQDELRRSIEKKIEELEKLVKEGKANDAQKEQLAYLKATKETGWGNADQAKRSQFFAQEVEARRLNVHFKPGSGGSTMAVIRGSGLFVGVGTLVVAAGNALVPDEPEQRKPMRSGSK
jgi:hypothetical protein